MKILLAILSSIVLSISAQATNSNLDVTVIFGQSNAGGFQLGTFGLPSSMTGANQNVLFALTNGVINNLNITNNYIAQSFDPGGTTQFWGSEISFGNFYQTYFQSTTGSNKIAIIKCAYGGKDLNTDFCSGCAVYVNLTNAIASALTNLVNAGWSPSIRRFIWIQGEQDATISADATSYLVNMTNLVSRIRTQTTGGASMPFLILRLGRESTAYPFAEQVRTAQTNAATILSGVYWANLDGLPRREEWLHYTGQGLFEMGLIEFNWATNFP